MSNKQAGSGQDNEAMQQADRTGSTRREQPQAGEGYEKPNPARAGAPQQQVEGAGDSAGEGLDRFKD